MTKEVVTGLSIVNLEAILLQKPVSINRKEEEKKTINDERQEKYWFRWCQQIFWKIFNFFSLAY